MRRSALLLAATLAVSAPATADPITTLYVFGDSLSDNGNLSTIAAGAGAGVVPAPPYAAGRASNGPVAVEYLASALGVPLQPALLGGTNYAVIGAATGLVPYGGGAVDNVAATLGLPLPVPTGLVTGQLQFFFLQQGVTPIDPDALFFIWAGANDIAIDPTLATAQAAADNIGMAIDALYGAGARRFLIPNLADLGATPGGGGSVALTALGLAFNARLADNLAARSLLPGITLSTVDTFATFSAIKAFPGLFGFTNATSPCVLGSVLSAVRVCGPDDESGYVFWDSGHPTTAAHEVLGAQFFAALPAGQVPEPTTTVLGALAVTALLVRRRRAA